MVLNDFYDKYRIVANSGTEPNNSVEADASGTNSGEKDAAGSPHIDAKDVGGKTPEEIEKLAGATAHTVT